MKPVIIHAEAELELWHAVSFYENRVSGLGLDFETETGRILAEIQETPKRYPKVKHGARRSLMRRFPYSVYYIELPEDIWIVAFAHTSRKPYYWLSRTKEQATSSPTEQGATRK